MKKVTPVIVFPALLFSWNLVIIDAFKTATSTTRNYHNYMLSKVNVLGRRTRQWEISKIRREWLPSFTVDMAPTKPSVALFMATKSGAQAITSYEDFEFYVLGISPYEEEDDEETQELDEEAPATAGGKLTRSLPPDRHGRPALLFFNAPWCGPCRLAIPVVRDIIRDYSDRVDAYEVDVDDLPEVAEASGVTSIPTIQLYVLAPEGDDSDDKIILEEEDAVAVETIVGCVSRNVLGDSVAKVLEDYS